MNNEAKRYISEEELLMCVDCREKEGRKKINDELLKLKPLQKYEGKKVPIEMLEKYAEKVCRKYNIRVQQITVSYIDGETRWYTLSMMDKKEYTWLGNVNGYFLWELMAKFVIKTHNQIEKGILKKFEEEKE